MTLVLIIKNHLVFEGETTPKTRDTWVLGSLWVHLPGRPEDLDQATFQCWHAPADTRCLSLSSKFKLCFKYVLSKKQHKPQATLIAISPGQTASKGVLLTHRTQEFSDDTRDKSVSQTQKVTHHNPTSRLIPGLLNMFFLRSTEFPWISCLAKVRPSSCHPFDMDPKTSSSPQAPRCRQPHLDIQTANLTEN